MTFNLKNIPKADNPKYPERLCATFYVVDAEEWFEGFEKQEQQRKDQAQKLMKERPLNADYYRGYIDAKKEILGES